VTDIKYTPSGQVLEMQYGNGKRIKYEYDEVQRLISKSVHTGTGKAEQRFKYQYDVVGNITQMTDSVLNETIGYTYDDLNRLIETISIQNNTENYIRHYEYDTIGNIISKSDVGEYVYTNNHPQQLSLIKLPMLLKPKIYQYDANGNITSDKTLSYVWDSRNRLTRITGVKECKKVEISNQYDYSGKRIIKITPNETRVYVGEIYEAEYGSGSILKKENKYIFIGGTRIATIEQENPLACDEEICAEELYYHFSDQYGEEREEVTNGDIAPHFTYTDQEIDPESGLMNYGARFYDPVVGRWMSNDPLQQDISSVIELGEFNGYQYVQGNPMKYIDPMGISYATCSGFWGCAGDFMEDLYYSQERLLWQGIITGGRMKGYDVAADLLDHSLQNDPSDLSFGNSSLISQKIKESSEYNEFVSEKIAEVESNGDSVINETWTNKNNKSIEFKSGDLLYGIAGTHLISIIGEKDKYGIWDINVEINDVYDFNEKDYESNNAWAMNEAGRQCQGEAINKYDVKIQLKDRRKNYNTNYK